MTKSSIHDFILIFVMLLSGLSAISAQVICDEPPIARAGSSISICSDSVFRLAGSFQNANSASWSSNGDGTFANINELYTTYTPGPVDISNGYVLIILTTDDPDGAGPCQAGKDTVVNFIYTRPTITFPPMDSVCLNDPPFVIPVFPQGGGFSGPGIVINKFNPRLAGVGTHTVYYVVGGGDCRQIDSTVVKVVSCGCDIAVYLSIGDDTYACPGDTARLKAELSGVPGGKWSSSGTGRFTDPNGLETLYLPSPADSIAGHVNITYTTDDPDGAGYCKPVKAKIKLALLPKPSISFYLISYANCIDSLTKFDVDIEPVGYNFYGRFNGQYTGIGNKYNQWGIHTPTDLLFEIYFLNYDCPIVWKDSIHFRFPERSAIWEILNKECSADARGIMLTDTNNLIIPLSVKINNGRDTEVRELPYFTNEVVEGYNYIEVRDSGNCIVYDTLLIRYNMLPEVLPDTTLHKILPGESVQLLPEVKGEDLSYHWSPAEGLSCTNCRDPLASPKKTTIYTLVVTDKNNCTATGQSEVIVLPEIGIYFPNTITPDHNGINDNFTVYTGYSIEKIISMKIFNRWGSLIFEKNNFSPNDDSQGWDGTFKGKIVDPGVYLYYLQLEVPGKGINNFKGSVNVIR